MYVTRLIYGAVYFIPVILFPNEVRTEETTEVNGQCAEGWFLYDEMCYKLFGKNESDQVKWADASDTCKNFKGNLVTIYSKEIVDFLTAFILLDARTNVWIGLNSLLDDSAFVWEDGSASSYRNWKHGEPHRTQPSGVDEDCVQMLFHSFDGNTGEWKDLPCHVIAAYICQSKHNGQMERYHDPRFCGIHEGEGWKLRNSCYHVVEQEMTWKEAEDHCQEKFSGHLVKILDFSVDIFLQYILSTFNTDIWIGIKLQDQIQQKWTSNWYVAYSKWKNESEIVPGNCVIRRQDKVWEDISCTEKHPFICEVSKDEPPVLVNSFKESMCPKTPPVWRDLGGDFCYFIDTKNAFTWYRANFECVRRGGTLVSFHSKEEVDILDPFVRFAMGAIHIGLYRLPENEEQFVWSDRSEVDFQYWNLGEPNNKIEKCVELWTKHMKWNDMNCGLERGYICSVKKIGPNACSVETETISQIVPNKTSVERETVSQIVPHTTTVETETISQIVKNANSGETGTVNQFVKNATSGATKTSSQNNFTLILIIGVSAGVVFVSNLEGVIICCLLQQNKKLRERKPSKEIHHRYAVTTLPLPRYRGNKDEIEYAVMN